MKINIRETEGAIKNGQSRENGQHWVHKTQDKQNKTHNTMYVGYHHTKTNTNNVNKTWALLQKTGGEDKHRFYAESVTDITT